MSAVLRRARAFAGRLGLLALLGFVAALLVTGVPRIANGSTDDGLRDDLRRLPSTVRDLTFGEEPFLLGDPITGERVEAGARRVEGFRTLFPAPLPALTGGQWFTARVGPASVRTTGRVAPFNAKCPPLLSVRTTTGAAAASTIVQGRPPRTADATGPGAGAVEATVSQAAAEAMGIGLGATFQLGGRQGEATVRVVGIWTANDPSDPLWDDLALRQASCPDPGDGVRVEAALLTDADGIALAAGRTGELTYEYRYRIDESRLTAPGLGDLAAAVAAVRRDPPDRDLRLTSGLEGALTGFDREQDSVAALLAVVRAGTLAALLGLILLAARLLTERRHTEYALLRARGGGTVRIGARVLAETLLVAPVAVAGGWLAGLALPGRAGPGDAAALLAVAALVVLAAPVDAALDALHPAYTARRRGPVRLRAGGRRLVAEGLVVLLAVLGVVLLRQRGLSPGSGADPYLTVVPVLVAVAAALVVRRLVPWPLRQAGRLAARARGAVPFLGLTGAGRAGTSAGPLVVLVLAVAVGVFSSAVSTTVADARDRAAAQRVGGDARIIGTGFGPSTAARLEQVPGVTAVAAAATEVAAPVRPEGGVPVQAQILAVDGPAMERVLRRSGGERWPAGLTGAARGGAEVPAVVSPDLGPALDGRGTVTVYGTLYRFRVVAVTGRVPGLEPGAGRFMVLPLQAMSERLRANRFLIAGTGADPAALGAAADAGQREYLGEAATTGFAAPPTIVTTRAEVRSGYERSGVNRVLTFAFVAGMAGAVVLALLTVGFTVLAGAPARGAALSRLRTLGLSAGQGRRLLVYEIVPQAAVAVLAGGAAGLLLPALVGDALGLSAFTAGVPARIRVDPLLVAGVTGVVALAVVVALLVESAVNRRAGLGSALRLGEEN